MCVVGFGRGGGGEFGAVERLDLVTVGQFSFYYPIIYRMYRA